MPTTKQATPAWRRGITPLFDADAIAKRTAALGQQIGAEMAAQAAEGLVALGVLRGSFLFFADLVRCIDLPMACEFVQLQSYGHGKTSSGQVRMGLSPTCRVDGQHVLVIEDIVDSGRSMQHLQAELLARGAKSVTVCALLHKTSGTQVPVALAYVGFSFTDAFVVGYGLDYCDKLRNLPYVGVVDPHAEAALADALRPRPQTNAEATEPKEPHATH